MTTVNNNTRLICVETGEYPIFLGEMGKRMVGSFGPTVESEVLEELGYCVVHEVTIPAEGIVTEGPPECVKGKWERVWISTPHGPDYIAEELENAKRQKLAEIQMLRNKDFAKGFPYKFNGYDEQLHVQIGGVDRINILAFRVLAKEAIEQGNEDWMIEFRVYEDIEVPLLAQEMIDLGDTAALRIQQGYKTTWIFKDQVAKAKSVAELPELPATIFP